MNSSFDKNIVGSCQRCGAPRGMIGWLCGHNGDEEHDRHEDQYWEDWAIRMRVKKSKRKDQRGE